MFKIYKTEQYFHPRREPIPASIVGTAPSSTTYIPTTLVPPTVYEPPKEIVHVAPLPYVATPAKAPLDIDKTAEKIAEMLAPTTQMLRTLEDIKVEQERQREERGVQVVQSSSSSTTTSPTIYNQQWLEEEARRRVRLRNGEDLLSDEPRGRLAITDIRDRRHRSPSVCSHRSHHSRHSRASSKDRGRLVIIEEPVRRSASSASRPSCSRCGEYGHRSRDCYHEEVLVLSVPTEPRRRARSVHYVRRPEIRYYHD